jgi:hypothetical protein
MRDFEADLSGNPKRERRPPPELSIDGVHSVLKALTMNTDDGTTVTGMQGEWTPSGHEMWTFQTTDGYIGKAYWRVAGAAIAVTRPDGTELFTKSWGAREIFPAAWPGMFEWLQGQVREQVTADRAKREQS